MKTDKFQIVVDHLVRITQEITEIKSNQQQFSEKLEQNSQAIARIEHNHGEKLNALSERLDKTNQAVARIEHDHGKKLNALFDAREIQLEVNDRILNTLSRIEEKLDHLSSKVAHHDLLLKKG